MGALPPDPAELHSAEGEHDQGDVVHHGVGLPALVHSQAVVDAERLLPLLDQGKLLWDVASKRIPEQELFVKHISYFHFPQKISNTCQCCLQGPSEEAWKRSR